ncbi:MAG TPA: lysophospholipid acyltransferase family protein [Gammaproteobacteria bacterium]|nr:lysophospholipid acyltransferase family protein [Gammaproteobacteria bacterium]
MPPTATTSTPYRLIYAAYAWFVLLFLVVPIAACCLLLPGVERRRAVARLGAGTVLSMIGSPVRILGEPLVAGDNATVVANHQSYLDGIILTAVLPPHYTFLIKREMVRVPIAGFVLSRLGSEFVDRSDAGLRLRSARRLVQAAIEGKALAVFPEGTFDAAPGLKPFRTGAFRAAWLGGLSIAPVVVTGARAKLPSDSWMPRPGPLTVEFCPRLAAGDFSDPAALMRAARGAILGRLNEPDLDDGSLADAEPDPVAALD